MKQEDTGIRFLYQTRTGRFFLKALTLPCVSKAGSVFLNSRFSRPMIGHYIKKYHINMELYEKRDYTSFNDFFTRKRTGAAADYAESDLISPCDGYLSVYKIGPDSRFTVKNLSYSTRSILRDKALAKSYEDGFCMIFRLAPYHYHHYAYVDSGTVLRRRRIDGILHCVRPTACEHFPVYAENSREYTILRSEHMGIIVQMEVGALLVGKIRNTHSQDMAAKGEEKGYFEFGGSTIILFARKGSVALEESFGKTMDTGIETEVSIGSRIGSCLQGGRHGN